MKTFSAQNGFFSLAQGAAKVDMGTIWDISTYAKADHVMRGFSILVAYRFDKQFRTWLFPKDRLFNFDIVNSDKQLLGYEMNTINVVVEYDYANYECPHRPRIQLFFDIPVSGKQIYKTKLIGLGLNFDW